jgi:hypothetical protein
MLAGPATAVAGITGQHPAGGVRRCPQCLAERAVHPVRTPAGQCCGHRSSGRADCYAKDSSGTLWDDVVVSTSGGVVNSGYVLDAYLYTGGDVTMQTSAVCMQP